VFQKNIRAYLFKRRRGTVWTSKFI